MFVDVSSFPNFSFFVFKPTESKTKKEIVCGDVSAFPNFSFVAFKPVWKKKKEEIIVCRCKFVSQFYFFLLSNP